jgi:hypothetical protein
MNQKKSRLYITAFLVLLMISLTISIVAASSTVTVYIYNFNEPERWKGNPFKMDGKTYWAGEIHIQYGGVPPEGTHARAYCMQYDVILYTGENYEYTIVDVTDTDEWKSVSYILSWYDPPEDSGEAAAVQGAIWKILTGADPSGYGAGLAAEAEGKDVARSTDTLEWLTPESYVSPGEEVTLTVKVAKPDGSGRSNVRIKFETTGGILDKDEGISDVNGEVNVTVTAPLEHGTSIEVIACTRGVWPEKYLDTEETQNLIGLGDELELTTTTDLCVIAYIHVIPEMPYGTLAAVAMFFFAFMIKTKKSRLLCHF